MKNIDDVRRAAGRDLALINRRRFAAGGLAAAGLLIGGRALAQGARQPTAESPLGPFYPINRLAEDDMDLTQLAGRAGRAQGRVIEVSGRVLDMRGNPIQGAVLELWQANAAGRYMHEADPATAPLDPDFQGFARLTTGASGEWRIITVKPGSYDSPVGQRTPHLHWTMQGRTHRTNAQMYFSEDAEANGRDTLYRALGGEAASSVAAREAGDPNRYRWDIVLMG